DRRRDAGAEHAELEDAVERAWARRRQEPAGPERRVAAVGDVHGVAPEHVPDRLHDVRGVETGAAPRLDHSQLLAPPRAIGVTVARDVVPPRSPGTLPRERAGEAFEGAPDIRDDAERDRARDPDAAWIDVDLDELLPRPVAPVLIVWEIEV